MANQPESATYDAGVYQLELVDPVQGGVGGKSNAPLVNLANRTTYLKSHVDALEAGTFIPPTVAPINSPTFTGSPAGPTAAAADDSTKFATTRYVNRLNSDVGAVTGLTNANVTLTSAQYGCGIVTLAGTLTGNINIVFPNAGKWIVENNTTGAFTITLKTTAGTGVLVKQGKVVPIAADGTNVVRQDSDLDSLALTGTPTAPTQSAGDSSTALATTAFVSGATAAGIRYRNRIINGAIDVQLRLEATWPCDRWFGSVASGTPTFSCVSNGPSAGLTQSINFTATVGAAPAAGVIGRLQQTLLYRDVKDWAFGTASAKALYLSFWVKSSLTGNFGVAIRNAATNRSFVQSYTIIAANTWEYKTISIPGDTTGTWTGAPTASVMALLFDLGTGTTNSTGTLGSWQASAAAGLTGGVKVCSTTGATWNVTGVQLEAGTVPTAFEYSPYEEQVKRCQSFYRKFPATYRIAIMDGNNAEYPTVYVELSPPMIAVPSLRILANNQQFYNNGSGSVSVTVSGGTPTYNGNSSGGAVILANTSGPPGATHAAKASEWSMSYDLDCEP